SAEGRAATPSLDSSSDRARQKAAFASRISGRLYIGRLAAMVMAMRPVGVRGRLRSFLGRLQQRERGSDALLLGAALDRMSEHDVADGEAAVPEQDPLVGTLSLALGAAHDLADLRVDVVLLQAAVLDQRMERAAEAALRPVVDHDLVHREGQLRI